DPAHVDGDHPRRPRCGWARQSRGRPHRALPRASGRIQGMNSIEEIVAEVRNGRMVVIMDDEARENEADLIMAAEAATPEAIAFCVRYTSGIICQPMLRERLQELRLPQMVPENTESQRTAFTISVDYRHGTTTGISAQDRSRTIRALADSAAKPD